MEDNISQRKCPSLPLSTLRLLVPPIRLVSAAIWQTVEQKIVSDYGLLEEFVFMVTDIVPQLLSTRQRAELILGLRARLILELCRSEETADLQLIQPHLDRMQNLRSLWNVEADHAEQDVSDSHFMGLVQNLLRDPEERRNFFQDVFPGDFGPTYDKAIQTLMWLFLSRLEKLLPTQTLQQIASLLSDASSVLNECMETLARPQEFKTLLDTQKDLCQLDNIADSFEGACIISALKLPSPERPEADETQHVLSCTSSLEGESLKWPHTIQIKPDADDQTISAETNWTPGENGTSVTRREENVSRLLKQCCVQIKRLDTPLSLQSRPVRPNRGLRMKKFLLEEKRGLCEDFKSASRKTNPSDRTLSEVPHKEDSSSFSRDSYMAPVNDCSEEDSWSYYSTDCSGHKTTGSSPSVSDSWSNYSGDESSFVTPVSSCIEEDSLSSCSNEDPSFMGLKMLSAASRKPGVSDSRASTRRKTWKVQCFICKEHVNTSLRTHMKSHFPSGDYACPRCDSRFKFLSSFKLHMTNICFEYGKHLVDPEKPDEAKNLYKCDKCDEAFRYKVSLQRHKITHNDLYCSVCRKVLRDAATLQRHEASHTLFQCTRCEESFTVFKPLLRHCQNIHKMSRPFKCNHCTKTMPKLRVLIAHEWKHTGHLPFQCAQCGLRCKTDANLISHERVHTGEKPYLCAECGKTFSQRSNLLRHFNLIHSESRNEKKHSCSQCEKSFKAKGALKKHQRCKHYNELFRHPCPYCGKMISSSTIARHKLIHTGEKPYKCTVPECDKYFRSTSEVKRHVLTRHTTERPHTCDVCGKGFIKLCFLNAHAKIHSGVKPFVCHICGKAFLKPYSMQRHKRLVHTSGTH